MEKIDQLVKDFVGLRDYMQPWEMDSVITQLIEIVKAQNDRIVALEHDAQRTCSKEGVHY